jgi:hypothetical protein
MNQKVKMDLCTGMVLRNVVVSPRPVGNTESVTCGMYVGERKCAVSANWDVEYDNPNPLQSKRLGVRMCDGCYAGFLSTTDIPNNRMVQA